jgi:dTDP-4-dehydrorhamnose reductase
MTSRPETFFVLRGRPGFFTGPLNDTALSMQDLVVAGARGVFNVTGPESVSRYELARLLLEASQPYMPAIKLAEIPFNVPRPLTTSLDVSKLDRAIHRRFRSLAET